MSYSLYSTSIFLQVKFCMKPWDATHRSSLEGSFYFLICTCDITAHQQNHSFLSPEYHWKMFLAGFSSGESQGSSTELLRKEFTPSEALEQKKNPSQWDISQNWMFCWIQTRFTCLLKQVPKRCSELGPKYVSIFYLCPLLPAWTSDTEVIL